MKNYEGTITIAVQIKAKNIDSALKILEDNPLETQTNKIVITSEHHILKPTKS